MLRLAAITAFTVCLVPNITFAAVSRPVSDPQALSLAAQALTAMTGGNAITDVTLTGDVVWFAGDIKTGTVTLSAKGSTESRVDLQLGSENRTDIRNAAAGPQGGWIGTDGVTHAYVQHNCWTDAGWFFPGLSSLTQSSNPNLIFSYIGQETRNGLPVQHLRAYQFRSLANDLVPTLSTMDFYLDSVSLLPLFITFNVHPDNDSSADIPMEIRFAKYGPINGVLVPFHVQQLFNGGLFLDFTVNSVKINSGLPDSFFAIP